MEPQHKDILRKHRLDLCANISTDDTIMQYLYQEDILTMNHVEEIQAQTCNKRRTLMLLDILPTRGPNAFAKFLEALEAEYPWVQEKLLQELDNSVIQVTGTGKIPSPKASIANSNIMLFYGNWSTSGC